MVVIMATVFFATLVDDADTPTPQEQKAYKNLWWTAATMMNDCLDGHIEVALGMAGLDDNPFTLARRLASLRQPAYEPNDIRLWVELAFPSSWQGRRQDLELGMKAQLEACLGEHLPRNAYPELLRTGDGGMRAGLRLAFADEYLAEVTVN